MNIRNGFHAILTERVPCRLDVVCNPVIDGLVILLRVHDIFVDLRGVVRLAGDVPGTYASLNTSTGGKIQRHTHMDTNGKAIGVDLLSSLDIDILSRGRRCRVEAWMMRSELATVRCKMEILTISVKYMGGRKH